MTDLASRTVSALRTHHDALTDLVQQLSDDQLAAPSGAEDWTLADVLSHLGSQAEIMLPRLAAAVAGEEPGEADNQAVWDRWDAASPREQAEGFVEHDQRYVEAVEVLTAEQVASVQVDLGFLPQPVPVIVPLGMRLNEVAQHAWDVRVGLDPDAEVDDAAAVAVLDHLAGPLAFLLGFTAKPDRLATSAVVGAGTHSIAIVDETVSVRPGTDAATATFFGRPGALVRLIGGRLGPERTPADVRVEGQVTLDDLRAVFPGF
ncbi:maleylpyruvate isomerase family mycothiol-dependent enzyme [Nocardioides sp. SYSU D00038]|uniref:maleylpyruvate isomerase family mycothiol-dependent enzyme n=1 Tax=Nocardioides sp. SYSU D00038 TaxID=2812554 RepID=UPI00196753E1|nr:maleylpyruvate isomerase family mycothiol-dependent enzyme [Nocardioides sp. SYSU D00038]